MQELQKNVQIFVQMLLLKVLNICYSEINKNCQEFIIFFSVNFVKAANCRDLQAVSQKSLKYPLSQF